MLQLATNYLSPNMSHPLNQGLKAWWLVSPLNFGGFTWRDIAGNNHGTLTDMVPGTAWRGSNRIGGFGALEFDGSDDYVSIANEPNFDFDHNDSFSLSAWAIRDSAAGFDCVMGKTDETAGTGYRFILQPTSGAVDNADSVLIDIAADVGSNLYIRASTPENSIVVGRWHHLLMTYNGNGLLGGITFYIDGVDQSLTLNLDALGGNTILHSQPIAIGASLNPVSHPFVGSIDDARVYSRVLSETEGQSLYLESLLGHTNTLNWRTLRGLRPAPAAAGMLFRHPGMTGRMQDMVGEMKA